MTTALRTDRLIEILEELYAVNLRPATLQEIGNEIGASPMGVRHALQDHIAEGAVVKLHGARGYMPAWAVQAIATEGLKRIQNEAVRSKIQSHINQPVVARVCDCMRNQIGVVEFPNPSTSSERTNIALQLLDPQHLILNSILPTDKGYDVIVHPERCDCGLRDIAYKCVCNAWVCDDCRRFHVCFQS